MSTNQAAVNDNSIHVLTYQSPLSLLTDILCFIHLLLHLDVGTPRGSSRHGKRLALILDVPDKR